MRGPAAAALVLCAALAGCTEAPPTDAGPCAAACGASPALLQGFVTDPDGAAVQATVAVGQEVLESDAEGRYAAAVAANSTVTVAARAPAFLAHTAQVDVGRGPAWHNITLAWRPDLVVMPWNGTVTCDAIVDVGHDHGSGGPDEDDHIDCDPDTPYPELAVEVPRGAAGLVAEVAWVPRQPQAQHLTAVLRDGNGTLLGWSEGGPPLRIQLPRAAVEPVVGATAVLRISAGAGEEDVTASLAYQQGFTAVVSLFVHQEAPATYTAL